MGAHANRKQETTVLSRQIFECTVFRNLSEYGAAKPTKDTRSVPGLEVGGWYHDAPFGNVAGPFSSRKAARTSLNTFKDDWQNSNVTTQKLLKDLGAFIPKSY